MAGGMWGRGRPDDHPLLEWRWPQRHVLCHRHCCWDGEAAKRGGCFPCSKDPEEQQAKHGGSPGAVSFLLWRGFGVPGVLVVRWRCLQSTPAETHSPAEPAAVVPVTPAQRDFNVGGGRLLHWRGKRIFLMKLCILIKRTWSISMTVREHPHFVPPKSSLRRGRVRWGMIWAVRGARSLFSSAFSRAATTHCMHF